MKLTDQLTTAFHDRTATIGVIGLGYVGLPLVRVFIDAGFRTLGFDTDPLKIDKLRAGESYISHFSDTWLAANIESGRFEPTVEQGRLHEPDAIAICVPTPLNEGRDPDLSFVETTTESIAATLRRGQLVVLESTTYPGTTRDLLLPILNRSQLVVGEDFFLAYSPERQDPGNAEFGPADIPKVVGGVDEASLRLADALYSQIVTRTIPVSSCEVAEACKILENTYRSVNIAMVNEMKTLFQRVGIDIWEAIDAAKSKPFGFQAFYPGPGLGGHCIPIDPFYLSWLARKHELPTRMVELAGEINASMPRYVVERVGEALNSVGKPLRGSKISILGMAYKPNIDDHRGSPSFKLLSLLLERGADVSYNDPHIPTLPTARSYQLPQLTSCELTTAYLEAQDCVLIATDHAEYDWATIVDHSALIVDTRNATREVRQQREKIWKA